VLPVKVVELSGCIFSIFELQNSTVAELIQQIQQRFGLSQDDYDLVYNTQVLSKDDVLLNPNEKELTIQLIKQPKIFMTTFTDAFRSTSLTPKGYADVIYNITIGSWKLEVNTYFFYVNPDSVFAKWKNKGRMRIGWDEDPGNFVALVSQGYDVHDIVMDISTAR
jgi:hypothetical protein